ncbi:hypothetical protein CCH79_00008791 [Gambusia affinis]|uniref:N-terminal EF-hand calcium-binding protein 1 n=1 Tax=Gambusia affinis TaxID=33528 RepID=A0A315UVI2_GAMAF|nr:hypothetical protein CCH79_00008791 [Gambusia affinis]
MIKPTMKSKAPTKLSRLSTQSRRSLRYCRTSATEEKHTAVRMQASRALLKQKVVMQHGCLNSPLLLLLKDVPPVSLIISRSPSVFPAPTPLSSKALHIRMSILSQSSAAVLCSQRFSCICVLPSACFTNLVKSCTVVTPDMLCPPRLPQITCRDQQQWGSALRRMDCSEELQSVSEEPCTQLELKKGMSIFIDILRRADKNDDGKLSFDEFKSYFSDGVLTAEELKELFHTIDTHNTDNVDTDELCEYFSQHLGEYENVLAALEELNMSILKAMDKTKKDYQESTHLEQFVTRFLLKETTNQLHSLQSSLECAMETTAEQTRQEKQGPVKPEVLSIQLSGRRSNRRLQRNNSLSPNNPLLSLKQLRGQREHVSADQKARHRGGREESEVRQRKGRGQPGGGPELWGVYDEDCQWTVQVNRLQKLIDRLEQKGIRMEPVEEEVLESKSHILIVQRQLSVLEEELEEFRLALRQYMDCACAQTGCLHIAVQRLANESRFILYEFWEHNNVWKNHLQTNYSKTFQRGNVDFLETPESITTMLVPAYRCFVADRALHDVLVQLPVQVDDGLADAAVDDGHAASVGAGDGCVNGFGSDTWLPVSYNPRDRGGQLQAWRADTLQLLDASLLQHT